MVDVKRMAPIAVEAAKKRKGDVAERRLQLCPFQVLLRSLLALFAGSGQQLWMLVAVLSSSLL